MDIDFNVIKKICELDNNSKFIIIENGKPSLVIMGFSSFKKMIDSKNDKTEEEINKEKENDSFKKDDDLSADDSLSILKGNYDKKEALSDNIVNLENLPL